MPEMAVASSGWGTGYGSVPASSIGTTVTSSVTQHNKGTLVELIAATEHDGRWLSVAIVTGGVANGVTGFLDILIGAATEQILIADLPVVSRAINEGGGGPYLFPLFVP